MKNAYYLPWTSSDNPNGWIEPTTFCQLKCPGCYRGLDRHDAIKQHRDLKELKDEIDAFIEQRNIQTLSIAGGEPLLYPHIYELIEYASTKNLRVLIYTNAIELNEDSLNRLKNSGATHILIHIDKNQGRRGIHSGQQLVALKIYYCNLFRKSGNINLGFIQTVHQDNLHDLPSLMEFYARNCDIVSLIVFTLYNNINHLPDSFPNLPKAVSIGDVVHKIEQVQPFLPCAYLGQQDNKSKRTWIFSFSVRTKSYLLGFFNGSIYKFIQERYRKNNKRYLFVATKHKINITRLVRYTKFGSVTRIICKYLKTSLFSPVYMQTLLILTGPEKVSDGWKYCDACPDLMNYNGRLVPSCILEDIKCHEKSNDNEQFKN